MTILSISSTFVSVGQQKQIQTKEKNNVKINYNVCNLSLNRKRSNHHGNGRFFKKGDVKMTKTMTKKEMIQKRIINILNSTGEKELSWLKKECADLGSARTVGRAIQDLTDKEFVHTWNFLNVNGQKRVNIRPVKKVEAPAEQTKPAETKNTKDTKQTKSDELINAIDHKNGEDGTLPLKVRIEIMNMLQEKGMSGPDAKLAVENIVAGKITLKSIIENMSDYKKVIAPAKKPTPKKQHTIDATNQLIMRGRFIQAGATKEEADGLVEDVVNKKITEKNALKSLFNKPIPATEKNPKKQMNRKQRKKSKMGKFARKNTKHTKTSTTTKNKKPATKKLRRTKAPKYAPIKGMVPRQFVKKLINDGKHSREEIKEKSIKAFPTIKKSYINTLMSRACSVKHKAFKYVAILDSNGKLHFDK